MRLHILLTERGLTPLALVLIVAAILIVLGALIYSLIAYSRSPESISLEEVSRTAPASGVVKITFEVQLTYDKARKAAAAEDIVIEEIDNGLFVNDELDEITVATAAGNVKSTLTRFVLECGPSRLFFTYLQGTEGSSLFERTHDIQAEYRRGFFFYNVRSPSRSVDCRG